MVYAILGFRRSGTTYISELIKSHPNARCLIEPFTLNIHQFRFSEFECWDQSSYHPEFFHIHFRSKPFVIEFLSDFKIWAQSNIFSNAFGFKEVTLHGKIPWLYKYLNPIRIIYIHRDPRNIIASFKKLNFTDRWGYSDKVRKYYKKKSISESQTALLKKYPEIYTSCLAYKISVSNFLRYCKDYEVLTIKLEDFVNEPVKTNIRIMNYLGLEPHSNQITFIQETTSRTLGGSYSKYRLKKDVLNRHQLLNYHEKELINELLFEEIKSFGYNHC
jgi:hypothetical protein